MNRKNPSFDDGKVAAVMRLMNPVTTKHNNLFDPTHFVNAPTSDSVKIGLAIETTMVLRLKNLFGTSGHANRFDSVIEIIHMSHLRWLVFHRSILTTHSLCSIRNCARARLRLQLCNFLCAICACWRFGLLILLQFSKDSAIGPSPNNEVSRVTARTLPNSSHSNHG